MQQGGGGAGGRLEAGWRQAGGEAGDEAGGEAGGEAGEPAGRLEVRL